MRRVGRLLYTHTDDTLVCFGYFLLGRVDTTGYDMGTASALLRPYLTATRIGLHSGSDFGSDWIGNFGISRHTHILGRVYGHGIGTTTTLFHSNSDWIPDRILDWIGLGFWSFSGIFFQQSKHGSCILAMDVFILSFFIFWGGSFGRILVQSWRERYRA